MKFYFLVSLTILLSACTDTSDLKQEKDYIVVIKSNSLSALGTTGPLSTNYLVKEKLNKINEKLNIVGVERKTFSSVVMGGVYTITGEEAQQLRDDPDVAIVEEDGWVSINNVNSNSLKTQEGPTWGLDRIDQDKLPLDRKYNYFSSSEKVNVYIIDTGIKIDHVEFAGRAFHGIDTNQDDEDATDCNGHGTHVAGTVGGKKYGVAKESVKLYGVRVLDCFGRGRFSDVIEGIEWVTKNHQKPAVANMSLGGFASDSIDLAVRNSVQAGVTYVVAAGNDRSDACNYSPARSAEAITVGATAKNDQVSTFSNQGDCIDIFAPGTDVLSAWIGKDDSDRTISGTSMASPHVAGAAAIYLSKHPNAKPEDVKKALVDNSTSGQLSSLKSKTPDLLLSTQFMNTEGDVEDPVQKPNPCPSCKKFQGILLGANAYKYEPDGNYYYSSSGQAEYIAQSDSELTLDLYLYYWNGSRWQLVQRGQASSLGVKLTYKGSAGYYTVAVISKDGAGIYQLYQHPKSL